MAIYRNHPRLGQFSKENLKLFILRLKEFPDINLESFDVIKSCDNKNYILVLKHVAFL